MRYLHALPVAALVLLLAPGPVPAAAQSASDDTSSTDAWWSWATPAVRDSASGARGESARRPRGDARPDAQSQREGRGEASRSRPRSPDADREGARTKQAPPEQGRTTGQGARTRTERGRPDQRDDDRYRRDREDRREREARRERGDRRERGAPQARAWERNDRDGQRSRRDRGGPPFCRSGQGHPVFGMAWCRERGFGGKRYDRDRYDRKRNDRDRYDRKRRDWRRHYGPDRYEHGYGRGQYGRWGRRAPRGATSGRPRWTTHTRVDIVFHRSRVPHRLRGPRRSVLGPRDLRYLLGPRVFARLEYHAYWLDARGPIRGRWFRPRPGVRVLQLRAGSVPLAEFTDYGLDGRVDVVLLNGAPYHHGSYSPLNGRWW